MMINSLHMKNGMEGWDCMLGVQLPHRNVDLYETSLAIDSEEMGDIL